MPRVHVQKITRSTYILRIDDDDVAYFEGLWEIPEGITYNAYLIEHEEKRVVIDTWKSRYSQEFIDALRGITDVRDIDYIVVNHMEPDHSGSLTALLEANRYKATILAHPLARDMIRSFYGINPRFRPVGDGELLDVGGGLRLRFIHTPWLHWPETIMTYYGDEGILFSCDAFGAYGIPEDIYDDRVDIGRVLGFARKYFASIIGYYRKWVTKALEKIAGLGLDIRVIAPSHGVVWRSDPGRILGYYRDLALGRPSGKKVAIVYASMYGFIEKAVRVVERVLSENNVETRMLGFTDHGRARISDVLSEVNDAAGIVVAAGTYEGRVFPIVDYLLSLIERKASLNKPALVISSYGWGGVAGRAIKERLEKAGYRVVGVVEFRTGLKGRDEDTIRRYALSLAREVAGG